MLRPRLLPLVLALLTTAALLLTLEAYHDLDSFAGVPLRAVLANERDDHGHAMHTVANMTVGGSHRFVALGGSALREALPPDRVLAREWQRETGRSASFVNLSTFDQGMVESLELFDTLAKRDAVDGRDTLLLSVNPRRLSDGAKQALAEFDSSTLPFTSRHALAAVLRAHGRKPHTWPAVWRARAWVRAYLEGRMAPGFRDALGSLVKLDCERACLERMARKPWFRRPRTYLQYAYPDIALTADRKAAIADEVRTRRMPAVRRHLPFAQDVTAKLLELAATRNVQVVLVDLPRDPRSLAAYADIGPLYDDAVQALVAQGAAYIDLRAALGLGSDAFYDLDHLRPAHRKTLARELLRRIEDLNRMPTASTGDRS